MCYDIIILRSPLGTIATWDAPPPGYVQLHSDGFCLPDPPFTGLGVYFVQTMAYSQATIAATPLEVEAQAILVGLQHAWWNVIRWIEAVYMSENCSRVQVLEASSFTEGTLP